MNVIPKTKKAIVDHPGALKRFMSKFLLFSLAAAVSMGLVFILIFVGDKVY